VLEVVIICSVGITRPVQEQIFFPKEYNINSGSHKFPLDRTTVSKKRMEGSDLHYDHQFETCDGGVLVAVEDA
jgi:hypothetical protein